MTCDVTMVGDDKNLVNLFGSIFGVLEWYLQIPSRSVSGSS